MTRSPRQRKSRGRSRVGERFEVTVGPIAHGGHCVARVPTAPDSEDLRVVFVRHALPGEQVVVEITEGTEGDRFWRGDAVTVLEASPDRVPAPCPVSGPGGCGGCDFQHVTLERQRGLKAEVVAEQLRRLAHLDLAVVVEPVPGDDNGLRWRTRQQYVDLPGGRHGLREHRSHVVVEVEDCLIARTDAREPERGTLVLETVEGREFAVAGDGFWQVHPGAPSTLVETVLAALKPAYGETVLDLYAGVGLFTAFLAQAVGAGLEGGGRVVAVEGDNRACQLAQQNVPAAQVANGPVEQVLATSYDQPFDLVVLDPPREGAKRAVVEQVVDRAPRAIAYVACDPAALSRDLATFAELGYRLETLRAFDLFPMTHHVECVALLVRAGAPSAG